jgi:hypothetical protein
VFWPTPSSAFVINGGHSSTGASTTTFVIAVADEDELVVGAPDLPEGIDYDRWVGLVNPASRERFADRLDLLETLDDD